MTSPPSHFVIYAFYRDRDDEIGKKGTIYYIGKGTPLRPDKCGRQSRKKGAPCPKDKRYRVVLHKNLDQDTAYEYEKNLIQFYGRADLYPDWGILLNKTDGGRGAPGVLSHNTGHFNNNRDWFHPVYGEFRKKASCEIIALFPQLKLSKYRLSELQTGKILDYRGWRKLENKDAEGRRNIRIKSNWFHEEHGIEYDCTAYELSVKYKNLNYACLKKIENKCEGRCNHKGWKILDK